MPDRARPSANGPRGGRGAIVRHRGVPAPLSPGQQGLATFYRLVGPELAARLLNMTAVYRVSGPLDLPRLEAAASRVIARHEILHARFDLDEPSTQVSGEPWDLRVEMHDVRGAGGAVDEDEAGRIVCDAAARPFDLAQGRPVRIDAVRVGADAQLLAVTLDHMVCDASSFAMFMREVLQNYAALGQGNAGADLPELPVQYADYARWQRERSDDPRRRDRDRSYWMQTLAGMAPLRLPFGLSRSDRWEPKGHIRWFRLDAADREGLAALASSQRATLFAAVLSAVGEALAGTCGSDEATLISFVSHRSRPECRDLIGPFANLTLLRVQELGRSNWGEAVSAARRSILGALSHSDLTFGELLHIPPALPLLNRAEAMWAAIHFYKPDENFDMAPGGADPAWDGSGQGPPPVAVELQHDLVEGSPDRTILPFDLHLSVWDRSDHLLGLLRYNMTIIDDEAAENLLAVMLDALHAAAAAGRTLAATAR